MTSNTPSVGNMVEFLNDLSTLVYREVSWQGIKCLTLNKSSVENMVDFFNDIHWPMFYFFVNKNV